MRINIGAIRKVLGVITNILTFGRSQGWWSRKNSIGSGGSNFSPPGR